MALRNIFFTTVPVGSLRIASTIVSIEFPGRDSC